MVIDFGTSLNSSVHSSYRGLATAMPCSLDFRMPPLHHYSASLTLPWALCTAYDHATVSQPLQSSSNGCRSGQGMYTVQAMPSRTSLSHRQRAILHNRPTAACLNSWYSLAFSHTVRLPGTEDAPGVWRAHFQCSCSKGVEQPTSAYPYCPEHWHF